jgi:nitric oxide reductase subunit B
MQSVHRHIIRFALMLLILGLIFGLAGAFAFNGEKRIGWLPFERLRPLHVSCVVFWIISAAVGGLIYYIRDFQQKGSKSFWVSAFTWLWIVTVLTILGSFLLGRFGGREYWEYPPGLSAGILAAWICFIVFFISTGVLKVKDKPVYLWMWATGIFFFLITFLESNLWQIAWFRENIIRDITVQWKANGALVGSWNMMIYGTSFYLMGRISGDDSVARKPVTFFFYFLGLTNLLFNWGHHTYVLPAAPWIRYVSYGISMTEWIIFLNIIRTWRKTVSESKKYIHLMPYRFLLASEFWVFANLLLALMMSIPAVNVYTHGTHITVAHAMGTTIGINTMILLASLFYILGPRNGIYSARTQRWITVSFWISQISLGLFWLSLITAGVIKGYYITSLGESNFQLVMSHVKPAIMAFAFSGVGLLTGLMVLAAILLRRSFLEV